MGITKTRMIAKRLCDAGKVRLDQKSLKPSHEILGGEVLDIFFPQKEIQVKVLEIPAAKSVAKRERPRFFSLQSIREV